MNNLECTQSINDEWPFATKRPNDIIITASI